MPPDPPACIRWELRRNCALRPGQLLAAVGALGVVHACLAAVAWAAGLAWVAAFALLDSAGLAVALVCYMRHACDRETLTLDQGRWLRVERHSAQRVEAVTLDAAWLRVSCDAGPTGRQAEGLLRLRAGGVEVCVGRHVRPPHRHRVAQELRQALRGYAPCLDQAQRGQGRPLGVPP